MLISLIIPTYGRTKELEELLESLNNQTYKTFEVLIVDQNDLISIDEIVNKYESSLIIKHIKSSKKGIAISKNIGIVNSKGGLITFPDDDCKYYPDTLQNAFDYFQKNTTVDIFYGRIYDMVQKVNIIRNWSDKDIKLNRFNFHNNYSAITCFSKNKDLFFDENFGVGSKYGCGEEFDYIMIALNSGMHVMYTPQISIWHPRLDVNVMSKEKVFYYAKGYGAVFRKNLNFVYALLFISSLSYQLAQLTINLFKADIQTFNKRWIAFKGRIVGFFMFINHSD
ncbi:MAG: glycosyltransferase family 2 protein [Bacteroidota bacterium]